MRWPFRASIMVKDKAGAVKCPQVVLFCTLRPQVGHTSACHAKEGCSKKDNKPDSVYRAVSHFLFLSAKRAWAEVPPAQSKTVRCHPTLERVRYLKGNLKGLALQLNCNFLFNGSAFTALLSSIMARKLRSISFSLRRCHSPE